MRFESTYINNPQAWIPDTRESLSDALAQGYLAEHDAEELGTTDVPVVGVDMSPAQMATTALQSALAESGTEASDVRYLWHCSIWHQGYDIWSPSHAIANALGLRKTIPLNVNQGCNAPAALLEIAGPALRDLEAQGDVNPTIAITSADRFLLPGFNRWHGSYQCVHGDAAAALLVQRHAATEDSFAIHSVVNVAASELEVMNREGKTLTTAPRMNGEEVELRSSKKSYAVKHGLGAFVKLQRESIHEALYQALAETGIQADDERIRAVTFPRMSRYLVETTYIPIVKEVVDAHAYSFSERTGHLSCSDVGANLSDLLHEVLAVGEFGIVVNAGGGFTWSATIAERVA